MQEYKIDLLDGDDEEAEGDDSGADEDLRKARQTLKSNKFENVFGIEGNESTVSSNLRKSREWFSKKSASRLRTSIAGKFF